MANFDHKDLLFKASFDTLLLIYTKLSFCVNFRVIGSSVKSVKLKYTFRFTHSVSSHEGPIKNVIHHSESCGNVGHEYIAHL